ncbi:MAG: cytochrome D1 domain-containing protein [Hydrogenobacter sp.]
MLPLIVLFLFVSLSFGEKLYVVERERGAIAVIEDDRLVGEIGELGNLNHATVKLWKGFAFVISRDGYLSKVDTHKDLLLKKVKVGNSSIGFDFTENSVVVANYDPDTVVVLDEDLKVIKTIKTGSRNVGIKGHGRAFVFSLMDKDEVWLVEDGNIIKFRVEGMPFDALLSGDAYLVAFFKSSGVGRIDIKKRKYEKLSFTSQGKDVVFKIPHLGTWGVVGSKAYIPAVGEKKIYEVDLQSLHVLRTYDLPGLPVFVVVSPNERYVAINFSGDKEDYVALLDVSEGRLTEVKAGQRVMHLRFSKDGRKLYVSSYFDSKLKAFEVPSMRLVYEVGVPNPSGIFRIE